MRCGVLVRLIPKAYRQNRLLFRVVCWGCGFAIALFCLSLPHGNALAQSDSIPSETSQPAEEPVQEAESQNNGDIFDNPVTRPFQNLAPPEIKAIFQAQVDSDIALASLYLDGRFLFQVTASASLVSGRMTATSRAREIEQRLESIAQDLVQSDSLDALNVYFNTDQESNQPVVWVNGEMVMTVTYLDAGINGSNSLSLRAIQIRDGVEDALRQFYRERQPDFLWQQVQWSMVVVVLTLLGSFAIEHFYQGAKQRRQELQQSHSQNQTLPPPTVGSENIVASTFRTTLLIKQRLSSLRIIKQSLRLLQIVLWIGSALFVIGLFPYTRWLQLVLIGYMRLPFRFILIALIAYSLIRLSSLWIDRLFLAFQSQTVANVERSQRLVLRLSTFSQVIEGVVAFVISGVAVLIMLSLAGVQVAPLLAGAGLVGFAVSFASQSLIKDIINGFLVLVEDQYGIGDVITARGMTGFVETMNLRITQLRASDGQLITIPNGQIDIVQNLSKEWSQVDLAISVDLETDIDQALNLVETVAKDMQKDESWGDCILEPPLLLGVDELTYAGATIRIWIKTQPLKQWDVAREYRRRLKMAFETAHIALGIPKQIVHFSGISKRIALDGEFTVQSDEGHPSAANF